MSVHGGGGHHSGGHGHGGGFRGRGGFLGFWPWPYPYPCDPLYDPACPYAFGADATDLHERVPGSMSPVGHDFGDEFHSRPAGSMVPVGCDWRMKL